MSLYATNEYIISSNNSMNDNKYNSQKASKSHKIKSILKPLLRMLKNKNKKQRDCPEVYCAECEDNSANEELESDLFDELNDCHPNSAIFVCNEEGQWNISPVNKGQTYVPVHFARTQAGTFFWTSINKCADSDVLSSRQCFTQCQDAAEQIPIIQDRWVQA